VAVARHPGGANIRFADPEALTAAPEAGSLADLADMSVFSTFSGELMGGIRQKGRYRREW